MLERGHGIKYLGFGESPCACVRQEEASGGDGMGQGTQVLLVGSLGRAALGAGDLVGSMDEGPLQTRLGGHRLEQPWGCFSFKFSCYLSIEDISNC